IDEFVEFPGAKAKTGYDLARVESLSRVGDDALFHQVQVGVGEHVRVNSKVLFAFQRIKRSGGNAAHPGADGRAVFDEPCHVPANIFSNLIPDGKREFEQRLFMFDEGVDMAYVNEGISQGSRHLWIHLSNYMPGALRRRLYYVHRYPVGAEPVVVGGRHLDQGDVYGHGAGTKQPGDIDQVYRRVVRTRFGHGFTACSGDKERLQAALVIAPPSEPGRSDTQDVQDFQIRKQVEPLIEALGQVLWFPAPRADENPVSASNHLNRSLDTFLSLLVEG